MAKKMVFANNPLMSGPALSVREEKAIPYREIPLAAIDRDTNQPRVHFDDDGLKELSDSITQYGVMSPILVRAGRLPGRYVLISGERRMRASKLAGLNSIPAIIDDSDDETGEVTLAKQLVENVQRMDLKPLEKAHAIAALKEAYSLSVRDVAKRLSLSKSSVQRSLELLDLPDDLLNALREGAPESKVLMIAKISDPEERKLYLKNIDSISRDEIGGQVAKSKGSKKSSKKKPLMSPEDIRIVDEMQRSLGLKVAMKRGNPKSERGKLTIEFYSEDDLQVLFRKLISEE